MDKIRNINSVSEYNEYWGLPDRHPYRSEERRVGKEC